ncbi:MAG TPA: thioredoxin domain-containing protein [Candidatus Limnocylindrales bacterium]
MTSNRPAGRPAKNTVPPTSRRSARQQRLANREANRALTRASTHGSSGPARGSLMLWSGVFVVVAVIVVGLLLLATQNKVTAPIGSPNPPVAVTPTNIPSSGRTLGNPNATVTIDLWGDFRCTGCFDFTTQGDEKSLVDNYVATGKAKLVWHDFTIIDLNQGNTASRDAANAARCGADQGKFWTMHDWLYANQDPGEAASAFSKSRLSEIARAAGLNMDTFQPCLDQGTHNDEIAAEQKSKPAEVTGTPTVFVNGKLVGLAYDQIKAAIDGVGASPAPSATVSPSATVVPSVSATASPS